MKSRAIAALYPLAVVLLVAGMVLAGAMAISILVTGDPAFPVKVFGRAEADSLPRGVALRPAARGALPRGYIDPRSLLPLPAAVVVPDSGGSRWGRGESSDTLYGVAAAVDAVPDLERARAAARAGRLAEARAYYDRLGQRLPENRQLVRERAQVLASFGEHRAAVTFLRATLSRFPRDVEFRMLAAHNAWWASAPFTADTLVGEVLALAPGHPDAQRLRQTIRTTSQPALAMAEQWAREGGPREQLLLARALVREERYGAAIGPFRAALADPRLVTDSLLLEAASAAAAADSVHALRALSERFLALHPGDATVRLRLARAYAWRGDYREALAQYSQLDRSDPALRFEVAQVLLWAGHQPEAERELRVVVADRPEHAEAFKLLGDLASWESRWSEALAHYARAQRLAPGMAGLTVAIETARAGDEQMRLATRQRAAPNAVEGVTEGYADNFDFRWFTTRLAQRVRLGDLGLRVSAQYEVIEGMPTGLLTRNPGYGVRLDASYPLTRWLTLELGAGTSQFVAVRDFTHLRGALSFSDVLGTQLLVEAVRGPSVARAATVAALQAQAMSDVLAVSSYATRGGWSWWVRGEREHLSSQVGGLRRSAFGATLVRTLSPRLAATIGLSAQSADGPAPVLPRFGSIAWAPQSYVEPTGRLSYRAIVARDVTATMGGQLGYAFVRERAVDARFVGGSIPTGGLSAELRVLRRSWEAAAVAASGGALGTGYRSGTVRLEGTYRPGAR